MLILSLLTSNHFLFLIKSFPLDYALFLSTDTPLLAGDTAFLASFLATTASFLATTASFLATTASFLAITASFLVTVYPVFFLSKATSFFKSLI